METIQLLRKFVGITSYYDISKNKTESTIAQEVISWFSKNIPEYKVTKIPVKTNRFNILITPKNPKVLFFCHLDTVAPSTKNQTKLKIKGDRAYGLGTKDMKGGWIASMLAVKNLSSIERKKAGFVFYCDEEISQKGMEAFVKKSQILPKSTEIYISPESRFNVGYGCRGYATVDIELTGKKAHSSRPNEGSNAGDKLIILCKKLKGDLACKSNLGETTVLLAGAQIGTKVGSSIETFDNVIPDYARGLLSFRISDQGMTKEKLVTTIEKNCKEIGVVGYKIGNVRFRAAAGGVRSDAISLFIQSAKEAGFAVQFSDPKKSGYNDVAMISSVTGTPFMNFGPYGENNHSADEWVSIQSIEDTASVFKKYIVSL